MRLNFTKIGFLFSHTVPLINFSKFFSNHRNVLLKAAFIILLLLKILSLRGEGSKELMADTSCRAALSTVDGTFAAYNSSLQTNEKSRLFIHIANPASEIVYLGFSLGYSTGNTNILGEGLSYRPVYYFRIKDPDGNVVFGPQAIDASNAIPVGYPGFLQVKKGAATIYGTGGYTPITFTPAAGAVAGNYYIEFNTDPSSFSSSQCSFDYWDITVADNSNPSAPTAINGRIWAYQWGFYSKSYSSGGYSGVFKGKLYSYTPEGFVNKIDFGNSDFRGGSFLIGMNSTGPGTSGNLLADRQSIYNAAVVGNEFKLFINDPDPNLYPTGDATVPALTINSMGSLPAACYKDHVPITFSVTRPGKVEILIDFDGNGIFDEGTRDTVLVVNAVTGKNTVNWNKTDGQGNTVTDPDLINVIVKINYELGIHHLSLSDIEYLTKGFSVSPVRPILSPGYVSKFYWDDSQIKNSAGNQVPYLTGPQPNVVELEGATERKWDNFTNSSTAGFGNKNSINTWWNSFQSILTTHFIFNDCGALPVLLQDFTVEARGNNVFVQWKMQNEADINLYEIEKSTDGLHFTRTSSLPASDHRVYNFLDKNIEAGVNYYRIKSISNDGREIYSDIKQVNISNQMTARIFPNPTADYIQITFDKPVNDGQSFVRIIGSNGKIVLQKTLTDNMTRINIDLSKIDKGNYYCQVITKSGSYVQLVTKL